MLAIVNVTFTDWLLGMLEDKGWSQAELARRASVTPTAISDVLSGRRNAGAGLAQSLAAAFKLPPEEVLRLAGILPEDEQDDNDKTFYRIKHLYHTLKDDDSRKRALDFLQFLKEQEDKNNRSGGSSKRK